MNFHFISGLPRSGSTLLSALLRQNPKFEAGISSGLSPLVDSTRQIMSAGSEVSLVLQEHQRATILRGLFENYYAEIPQEKIIFDTNRSWCGRMPLLQDLFPQSKIIACVREIPWVMDSIERIIRKNPYENTRLFNEGELGGGVSARVDHLAQPNRLVGSSYNALKEAFYSEQASSLLVIEYEYLARMPEQVLKLVYEFINEPWFDEHHFDNIEFETPKFDEALGVNGLHKVKPKVEFIPRKTILPPDVVQKYSNMEFWRETAGSNAHVIAFKQD